MCKAENCNRLSQTRMGYCIKHYKLWKRNGTPERVLRAYTPESKCEGVENCKGRPVRKGLCNACATRLARKGYVDRDMAPAGSGTITKAGYKLVTRFGEREYEHRIIAKAKIGEVVHHKDGDKLNNSRDNLEVLPSQSDHMKLHWKSS